MTCVAKSLQTLRKERRPRIKKTIKPHIDFITNRTIRIVIILQIKSYIVFKIFFIFCVKYIDKYLFDVYNIDKLKCERLIWTHWNVQKS